MYCMSCGGQVPKGNKFCNTCGASVVVEEATPVANSASQPLPAPVAPPASPPAAPRRATRRVGRTLVIVLLTMFLTLGAAVGVGYWIWSSPPTVDPSNVETLIVIPKE